MVDSRLNNLGKMLDSVKNTFPTAKCSLRSCKKPYYQNHLRERYCSNDCRISAQRLQNRRSKKKSREGVREKRKKSENTDWV